jgi:multifunctional beta-oxidation protein
MSFLGFSKLLSNSSSHYSPINLEDNDAAVRSLLTTQTLKLSPLTTLIHNTQAKLALAAQRSSNEQAKPEVRFDGKTVIITGAGAGLGRAYALMYAKLGANVVVNDVSEKAAGAVVEEIAKCKLSRLRSRDQFRSTPSIISVTVGGNAAVAICSAEDGETIVKKALDAFGSVHILIANAGILRDKSFVAMTEKDWDDVIAVHLR